MTFSLQYPNINALWSSLLIEELWRLGVRHCCIAPGSRSAPLTLVSAEHHAITTHVHFDERGLGFFALGLAKSSLSPVAIITTSGTAVANLYPAIIEARQSAVPLVIITADRPPELIDCGANQAIEQQDIYAGYPGATLNLPTPTLSISANWILTSVDQAFARSCLQGLPLHINCMFREPLYPQNNVINYSHYLKKISLWLERGQPHTVYQLPSQCVSSIPDCWQDFVSGQGVIVVGRMHATENVSVIIELARKLNWPLVADIQSQLHGHPEVIPHVDLLLANEKGKALFQQADRVFQIGGHLISKRLEQFLGSHSWQHFIMLGSEARRMDAGHCQTTRLVGSVQASCQTLLENVYEKNSVQKSNYEDWTQKLFELGRTLTGKLTEFMGSCSVTEQWLGANLSGMIPDSAGVFIGNSLPIRLLELFSSKPLSRVYTNRGASGIDGLLATASGCAVESENAMVVLLGDLSFLHDLNSLQLAKKVKTTFVILLINNDGGGIFSMLPMSDDQDKAAEYFQLPHGLDAEHSARMFGTGYFAPETVQTFNRDFAEAISIQGCSIIEVKTEPGAGARDIKASVRISERLCEVTP